MKWWLLLGAWAVAAFFPATALACAVCIAGAGESDGVLEALNWSVLFLMAMPYAVAGTIGGWLFLAYRRERHGLRAPLFHGTGAGRRMADE